MNFRAPLLQAFLHGVGQRLHTVTDRPEVRAHLQHLDPGNQPGRGIRILMKEMEKLPSMTM